MSSYNYQVTNVKLQSQGTESSYKCPIKNVNLQMSSY